MNIKKYALPIFVILTSATSACNLNRITMTDDHVHDVLKRYPTLEKLAWVSAGNDYLDNTSKCIVKREIMVYSKPTIYSDDLVISKAEVIEFKANQNKNASSCGELLESSIKRTYVAKYGYDPLQKNMHDYFEIRGGVTGKDLKSIGSILTLLQKCLSGDRCDNLSVRNAYPNDGVKLHSISIDNIGSIRKLPSLKNQETFMILLNGYSEKQLAIFVSDIYSKSPHVDIEAVLN